MCHRWADEFERQYTKLDKSDMYKYVHVEPYCNVWYEPGWGTHSVIIMDINGQNVYLDHAYQGGNDNISFDKASTLLYPGTKEYDIWDKKYYPVDSAPIKPLK
jgi:hypothetical protein